jgi:hypothetical protein
MPFRGGFAVAKSSKLVMPYAERARSLVGAQKTTSTNGPKTEDISGDM